MNCKDCKYYNPPEDDFDKKLCRGKCTSEKFVYNVDMDFEKDYPLGDRLEYWDSESYSAGFYVGENFGCKHYKKLTT